MSGHLNVMVLSSFSLLSIWFYKQLIGVTYLKIIAEGGSCISVKCKRCYVTTPVYIFFKRDEYQLIFYARELGKEIFDLRIGSYIFTDIPNGSAFSFYGLQSYFQIIF